MRLAATRMPATRARRNETGTTATGKAPSWVANRFHSARPAATPTGTPIATPTRDTAVACQTTAQATWRFVNPSTFRSPVSRRRRDTLTTNTCTSVAAPKIVTIAPNMSGKLIASPKLANETGVTGSVAYSG